MDWQQPTWRETTLLTDRAVQFATAKTFIFSHSVLCLKAWESKIKWFLETRYLKDLDRIDGEQMEFDWKFSRIHHMVNSRRDSKDDD